MDFRLPFYKIPDEVQAESPEYPAVRLPSHSRPVPLTLLGTPWEGKVDLGDAKDHEGRSFQALSLPPATLTDVSVRRNIVSTQVAGGHGTIKELTSSEDWQVRMRGLAIGEGLDLPEEFLKAMATLAILKCAVPVTSDLLVQIGVTHLVITDISINMVEGRPGAVQFEITALADEAPEVTLLTIKREASK